PVLVILARRPAPPQLHTLSLHDALPISAQTSPTVRNAANSITAEGVRRHIGVLADDSMLGRATPSPQLEQAASYVADQFRGFGLDRKSTRLNSSHDQISYAVFCLKKKII